MCVVRCVMSVLVDRCALLCVRCTLLSCVVVRNLLIIVVVGVSC